MSYLDILSAQLEIDEGRRPTIYTDTTGNVTFAVGHNGKVPLSDAAIDQIKTDDMATADAAARALCGTFEELTDARKAVMCNMAFNMGQAMLATFTTFLRLVDQGNYDAAADDMLGTLWAKQVGARATRLAQAMREG